MTIIPSAALVVNVARSGGILGRTVAWRAVAPPSSATHDAAVALLRLGPPVEARTRSRDAFTYAVTIVEQTADATPLLDVSYHDPAPRELADLLAVLIDQPPQG
ncbi:MAG: hypothetical protein ABIR68_04795 [Ilumatobacteraceae bacterium]